MTSPTVIDGHVHLYPPEVNRDPAGWAATAGEPIWNRLCTRIRRNGRAVQGFPSVDELLREMDRAGVARAVLLGWYWEQPATCRWQNQFYAECVRSHPDRLAAFATVQPRAGAEQALAEMRRARDDGLVGLGELSPHTQGHAVADPAFRAVLEQAAAWHWAVNLHVDDPDGRDYPGRVRTPPADFLWLARQFPSVTVILAHWGGLLPLRDPEAARCPNLWYDTAASALTYDETVWSRVLATVPADRVLFGSDYPLNLYPRLDAEPSMVRFVEEVRRADPPAAVLAGNLARLLVQSPA